MIIKLNKKAQSMAEYVMLLGIVVGAITLATSLTKKSLAGKIQAALADFGNAGPVSDIYQSTKDTGTSVAETLRTGEQTDFTTGGGGSEEQTISSHQARKAVSGDLAEETDTIYQGFKLNEVWNPALEE